MGENIPGGNFPEGEFSRGSFDGWEFSRGKFSYNLSHVLRNWGSQKFCNIHRKCNIRLKTCNFIKKTLQHKCFSWEYYKTLKQLF